MTISDELKSLSEQVKKMTTTIAKLILARSPHGTSSADENIFDKLSNGLPRNMKMEQIAEFALTSKVILSYKIDYLNSFHDQLMKGLWKRSSNGCIYPLDNSYEKILYVEINEDYKVDSEKLMEELRSFSVTYQVFDEMSESVLNTNHGQIPLSEDNQGNNGLMFDFDNSKEIQVGGECTHGYGNEETQADGISLSLNRHLLDEVDELRGETDSHFIEEIQQPNACEMLDELPLPDFIKEMVEAAKIAELDSAQGNSDTIYEDPDDDSLAYKQNFAKLGTLDGPYFWDLVILGASRGRFSRLQSVVFMSNQTSDQLLLADLYDRNLTSKCPLFQVINEPLLGSHVIPSMSLAKNVVWPFWLSDFEWFVGSNLSMKLVVEAYDTKAYELGLGCRMIVNVEELHSWGLHSLSRCLLLSELTLGHIFMSSLDHGYYSNDEMIPCILIFDPGDILLLVNFFIAIDSRAASYSTEVMVLYDSMRIFDLGGYGYSICDGVLRDCDTQFATGLLGYPSLFHDFLADGKKNILSVTSLKWDIQPWFFTLEDKGDFNREGVYPMSTYNICVTNGYVIWPIEYIESMNLTWDPGIIDKIAYEQCRTSNVLRVGCRKDIVLLTLWLMKCWAASSWISDVGAIGYVNFGSLSKHWSVVLKFMDYTTMILGYVIKNQNDIVSIFDPGGFKSWLKMRNRLEAYQFTGCKLLKHMRYEDYHVYVFDLGGPLVRLVVGNTSILIEMIWVKKCAARSYKFLDVSSSFFIFDPGSTNEPVRGETCHTSSLTFELAMIRTMLKWKVSMSLGNGKLNNLSGIIFVFDPGGLHIATWSYVGHDQAAKIKYLQPKRMFC